MTPLPERKKSPEEIAQLRESLGAPLKPFGGPPPSARQEPTAVPQPPAAPAPAPADPPPAAKLRPVRSLKRSERAAFRMVEETPSPTPTSFPEGAKQRQSSPDSTLPTPRHDGNSKIPSTRHSDQEIANMRRRDTLSMLNPVVNPKLLPAHPALLTPAYLGPLITIVCIWMLEQPLLFSTPSCGVSLSIAAIIALRKPVSRHHAGFIAVITIAVLICAAFHYFPHLLHAT